MSAFGINVNQLASTVAFWVRVDAMVIIYNLYHLLFTHHYIPQAVKSVKIPAKDQWKSTSAFGINVAQLASTVAFRVRVDAMVIITTFTIFSSLITIFHSL